MTLECTCPHALCAARKGPWHDCMSSQTLPFLPLSVGTKWSSASNNRIYNFAHLDNLVGRHSWRGSMTSPVQPTKPGPVHCGCCFTAASTALPPLQEEEWMAAHTSARSQDLLQVPGQHHCHHSLNSTHACDIDPVVVVVVQIAEVETVTPVLICCLECICGLQYTNVASVHSALDRYFACSDATSAVVHNSA